MSKTFKSLSGHLQGWHVIDVYNPYRAPVTVKFSSLHCKRFHYKFPYWLTTTEAELKEVMFKRRLTCKQMADTGKLMLWRSLMWTQI